MSFCSREAQRAGDVLPGTAPRGEAYVFLPVPKGRWRDNEMNLSWAKPEELAALVAARKAGVVTRLYNPAQVADPIIVYVPEETAAPEALGALLALLAQRGPLDDGRRPRLAVCTHGTRDRCCAKWGFEVYMRARRLWEQGASPFEPLETSHLGGDRFAATGIFFPGGGMYAHLDRVDLAALASAESARRIAPEHYRGRVYDPQLTQVVRAGLAGEGLYNDATAPLAITRRDPAGLELLVAAEAGRLRFQVVLSQTEVRFYPSCARLGQDRPSSGQRLLYAGGRRLAEPASI